MLIWIKEFFKRLFIYYCDFYGKPRIEHDSPRWCFELSECFLIIIIVVLVIRVQLVEAADEHDANHSWHS